MDLDNPQMGELCFRYPGVKTKTMEQKVDELTNENREIKKVLGQVIRILKEQTNAKFTISVSEDFRGYLGDIQTDKEDKK